MNEPQDGRSRAQTAGQRYLDFELAVAADGLHGHNDLVVVVVHRVLGPLRLLKLRQEARRFSIAPQDAVEWEQADQSKAQATHRIGLRLVAVHEGEGVKRFRPEKAARIVPKYS
jgi:hypothetical protein